MNRIFLCPGCRSKVSRPTNDAETVRCPQCNRKLNFGKDPIREKRKKSEDSNNATHKRSQRSKTKSLDSVFELPPEKFESNYLSDEPIDEVARRFSRRSAFGKTRADDSSNGEISSSRPRNVNLAIWITLVIVFAVIVAGIAIFSRGTGDSDKSTSMSRLYTKVLDL